MRVYPTLFSGSSEWHEEFLADNIQKALILDMRVYKSLSDNFFSGSSEQHEEFLTDNIQKALFLDIRV